LSLVCLTWWSPVLYIFCKLYNFIFFTDNILSHTHTHAHTQTHTHSTSHFLFPLIGFQALGLVPEFSYCEESCNKYACAGMFLLYWFILLQIYA
jgi:hypothetical protein